MWTDSGLVKAGSAGGRTFGVLIDIEDFGQRWHREFWRSFLADGVDRH